MGLFMMTLRLLHYLAKEENQWSLIEKYTKKNGMALIKLRKYVG